MKKTIVFNKNFLEFKEGQTVEIDCDDAGTPSEKRFRKLLKNAEIDGTVSIEKPVKKKAKKSQKGETKSTELEPVRQEK
jgi:hypothetical protein